MQKRSNWKPFRRVIVRVLHTLLSCGLVASALAQKTGLHDLLFNRDIKSWLYVGFYCASAALSLVFYLIACGIDPGFVPLQSRSSVQVDSDGEDVESCQSESGRMISSGLKLRHCGFCGIEQPLRARHCEECDRCVRCFDHHCPWLGVCVGELNHRYFLLFLLFTATSTVWTAVIIWQAFRPEATVLAWLTSNVLFLFDMFILLPAGATVICLVFVHVYTAFANVTTWEFVSKHRITYLKQADGNPFHQGYCKNCFVFLCACGAQRWEETWEKFAVGRTKTRGMLQRENEEEDEGAL